MSSPYFSQDDIAQIASAPGPIGILRLSGSAVFAILARTTTGLEGVLAARPARGVHSCRLGVELTRWTERDGRRLRETSIFSCPARAFLMPGPASYTREDMAELHIPGAPLLLEAALASLVRAGARPAAPGEFTFRAFRNGRIGLGQAEAVEEVIRSADDGERRAALERLDDDRRETINEWREKVMTLAAGVEAALDFSEETLEGNAAEELAALAAALEGEGAVLAATGGIAPSALPRVALAGLANAGKSSLFNALLGEDASLVSPRPGATRDHLRRRVVWAGAALELSDNPGYLPEGGEDRFGAAERGMARLGTEDAVCWVIDSSRPLGRAEEDFARRLSGIVIAVLNKGDLPPATTPADIAALAAKIGLPLACCLRVSALSGDGVAALRARAAETARGVAPGGRWNRRETLELAAAREACGAAARELAGAGRLELAAEDLRRAAEAFARVLGEGYAEDVLTRIFSRFCLGK